MFYHRLLFLGPVSRKSRNVFAPGKPYQNLKTYEYRAVLLTQVPFILEVSVAYTPALLDTDEPEMASRARNISGHFDKRDPGQIYTPTFASTLIPLCAMPT